MCLTRRWTQAARQRRIHVKERALTRTQGPAAGGEKRRLSTKKLRAAEEVEIVTRLEDALARRRVGGLGRHVHALERCVAGLPALEPLGVVGEGFARVGVVAKEGLRVVVEADVGLAQKLVSSLSSPAMHGVPRSGEARSHGDLHFA